MNGHMARWARLLMLAPGAVGIALFILVPTAMLVWLSLYEQHAYLPEGRFVGLSNYWQLLVSEEFWQAVKWTVGYALSTTTLQLVVGTVAALALARLGRKAVPLLSLCIFPYVLPTVVVTMLWRWLLNDTSGLVNLWASSLGLLPRDFGWFQRDHVFCTVVLVSVWQFFPFVMLMFYARLISIPKSLYEGAAIDGLSPAQAFWRVTLPQLRPVLLTVILLRGLWMFTKFDTVWLLTGREAAGQFTHSVPILSYLTTFGAQQMGLGAAMSIGMVALLFITAGVYTTVLFRGR